VRFFKKIQDWILKSENGFCFSLSNRLIQVHSDHGASKEPKNPWIFLKKRTHNNVPKEIENQRRCDLISNIICILLYFILLFFFLL